MSLIARITKYKPIKSLIKRPIQSNSLILIVTIANKPPAVAAEDTTLTNTFSVKTREQVSREAESNGQMGEMSQ